ncbi:hypothetical protein EDC65_0319 [Stella humosa]|uniref:Uncharacterized protein n=1 Tax=Stella humosa TaxID=94 RepID=A0A3N1M5R2_9PROT|nr:hypothetical protein [Stella humosa]ROQ01142.1 hypothetical protein EDC65_0319 [Stella humosa]BBK31516.1 hypothetical protein STHU_21500 [Stella humosa]
MDQDALAARVADLEAQVAVLQSGGIAFAQMVEDLAKAIHAVAGRLDTAEANIVGLADVSSQAADVVLGVTTRLAAVEAQPAPEGQQRPPRRRLPGRP